MRSGVVDKYGEEVRMGDTLILPYIDPMGRLTEDPDEIVKVVFDHGCFGYYTETSFIPLIEWQERKIGEYIPNEGNKVIYTGKYPFWVER